MTTVTGIRVISTDGPIPQEEKHSLILDMWCENTIEPEEESDRRRTALDLLRSVCKSWIHKCYVDEFNLPANEDVGGRIFTTGSYRYNAHSSGSDIDVVLIAPERLTLQHFTSRLPQVLKALPQVTDMVVIAEARVPLISMKICGIDFDLSFGNICRPRVPDDNTLNMLDDNILIGLSPQSTKAANAVRVADLLIKSVPNVAVFRQVLRFVKVWAKARGVYSFKIGFPSGIGWAILCAKICQCYPNKNGAGTVFHFFAFFAHWFRRNPSPQNPNRAIFLTASHTPPVDLRRSGVEPSWNPQERMKDARALFPVLTPAYPYQDSCDNVSMTTLAVLCDEFRRAHDVVRQLRDTTLDQIPALHSALQRALQNKREVERDSSRVPGQAFEKGKEAMKGVSFGELWEKLLEPYPFFTSFTHYIRITISATNPTEYRPWVETMEAKLCSLWKENPRFNKGAALECWAPFLQIRPHNVTFEDPKQQERLKEAKAAMMLQYQADSTNASNNNNNNNNNNSTNEVVQASVFSAYGFIGVYLAPGAKIATGANSSDPGAINFPRAIHAFVERCNESKARFASAQLPVIDIVKRGDLPSWLPGTVPEEELLKRQQQEQEQQQQKEQEGREKLPSAHPSNGTLIGSASTVKEGGIIRERGDEEREQETHAGTTAAAAISAQDQNDLRRQKILLEEKLKKEEEDRRKKREEEIKEREAERTRQLQLEQQRRQQTEVESLMGFDF